jgi:hypothetical protein
MLRMLRVVGEMPVLRSCDVIALESRECQDIAMAMSNYNKNAQEQVMAASAMAMLRLGVTEDDIRKFLEIVLKVSADICKDNPFPCQCSDGEKTKMTNGIFERNYYEVMALPM